MYRSSCSLCPPVRPPSALLRSLVRVAAVGALLLVAVGCPDTGSTGSAAAGGSGGPSAVPACPVCLDHTDCAGSALCTQIQGDTFCLPPCDASGRCAAGAACQPEVTSEGDHADVCVPLVDVCTAPRGGTTDAPDAVGGTTDPGALDAGPVSGDGGGAGPACPGYDKPDAPSCCHCTGAKCTTNGCYNGWYCFAASCQCRAPAEAEACGGPAPGGGDVDGTRVNGGTLASLDFAIVGDTRPPFKDGTSQYPTSVITALWGEVAAEAPAVPFAITTGDYVFANPWGDQAGPQLDLYLGARAQYAGAVYYTLGNHECTGYTTSNCGTGNKDGTPRVYQTFLDKLIVPLGATRPFYRVDYAAQDGTWTAKIVVIAANAWDAVQAGWLEAQLAEPTTYTFVVRHEGSTSTTAPGVTPSQIILHRHPYTLLIVGHTHTYAYYGFGREMVVGNGGAPLTGNVDYGFVIARQRADQVLELTARSWKSHGVVGKVLLHPDGSPAQ